MKKTAPLLALLALGAAGTVARAEVSSTLTLASDYDFRGVTQTALDPALQASLDWSGESGFYAGAWASNVDFGPGTAADVELDLLLGYAGNINDELSYDIGVTRYNYFDDGDDGDYQEFYAGLTYKMFSAKLWYTDSYFNSGDAGTYLEANVDVPLPNDFALSVHVGRSSGDFWDNAYGDGYTDYSIGVTKTVGNFELGVKWVDGSDLAYDRTTDANSADRKALVTVSTTLPW